MAETAREVDVGQVVQESKLGPFQIATFALCVLILFVDGLDYSSVNVAAPEIIRAFKTDTGAMGYVFSWGFVGFFFGSVLFGFVGDRWGRKTGAIAAVLTYTIPSLLTVFASSLDELSLYRCLAGFGIGGVIPNTVALLNETAPAKYRVMFVMAAFVGYSTGNAAMGPIARWFIPSFGWPVVFLIAGVAGAVLAIVLLLFLSESIPFLAATKPDAPQLRRLLARAAPRMAIAPDERFVLRRPVSETKFSLNLLFDGERAIVTPLLWLAFFAETLTYITLSSWLAVLLERAGLAPQTASVVYGYAALGAVAAILIVGRLLDRFGPRASVLSALIAVAATVALGTPGLTPVAIVIFAIFAMGFGSATHNSLLGIVGGFYPTIVRGNGVGFATSMGRIAAIFGPGIAGYLLARLPLQYVLMCIAAPDLIVAAICVVLARYARANIRSVDEITRGRGAAKAAE